MDFSTGREGEPLAVRLGLTVRFRMDSELRVTSIEPTCRDLTGFAEDQWIHRSPLALVPRLSLARAQAGEGAQGTPLRLRHADGSLVAVHLDVRPRWVRGELLTFDASWTDVTALQQRIEETSSEAHRLQLAVHGSGDGIWDWDLAQNTCWMSPRFKEMLGYAPTELPDTLTAWIQCLHPEEANTVLDTLHGSMQTRDRFSIDHRLRRRDGDYQWFRFRGRTAFDDDGTPRRAAGSLQDIDRSKRIELNLAAAKQEAEAANLAKSAFLANMSHEIRTPMTAILGFLEVLLDPELSGDQRGQHAVTVRENADHLLHIVNDILDLSKIESDSVELEAHSTDLPSLVRQVIELKEEVARQKGVALTMNFAKGLDQHLELDPTRVRQVLLNLVDNAIKFTAEGQVTVRVRRDAEAPSALRLSIRDSGIGMTPEQLQRVFAPFGQADSATTRKYGGTGLGLAISRRLARLMGGDLHAESALNAGSIFHFSLPYRPATPPSTKPEPSRIPRIAERSGKILLAEDGIANQRLICLLVERAGYQVDIVSDGQEALDYIHSDRPLPDLLLLDMFMPNLDGYDTARALRDSGCNLPILALTANAMAGDRERCIDAGCDDYLTKPVDRGVMVGMIDRYIRTASRRSGTYNAV